MDKELFYCHIYYGPNGDNPEFYVQLEERINEVCSENIVVGGDWN